MHLNSIAAANLGLSSLTLAAPYSMTNQSTPTSALSLTAQLQLADTALDRYRLLTDRDFVFSYNESTTGLATRKSFPALVSTGASMAIAEFGPCAMASLHIHPRAAELFLVIFGQITTEMTLESGAVDPATGRPRVVRTVLGPRQMTVFPQGAFHTQINTGCTPALTVAAFAAEDAGASLVVPQTLGLGDEFVMPSFGGVVKGEDVKRLRGKVPQTAIFAVEECLGRCGMRKRGV
ncbi:RmlC-like cupin domain-containing protein [Podospora appendiculata]|uniref:RmlC-like cupin domain-containing protein n=1 Tax=Podospora appendiculata TaxID=314037 RepID=A0AAE0XH17_9PEZI|nr:RmlC-like cupin domain-containing protein [Podospora appendiculata]